MALIFFILISLGVGAGLLWVLEKMVFRGKWSYFIYFLAGFLPFYITILSIVYLATRSPEIVGIFQIIKELVVVTSLLIFVLYQKKPGDYPYRLQSVDWFFLGFLSLGFLYLLLPIGQATFLNKALYFKSMLIPGLVYFLGRNTSFSDFEIHRIFQVIFWVAIGAFVVNLVENFLLNAHLQQFTGYALYNQAINDIDPTGNFGLTWTFETQAVTKRLASFFSDPLEMASSVLMGFAAGLIWFLTTKREQHWYYLLVMGCSLGSLVFSASRAAFGAFFVMIFFIALVFRLYKLIGAGFLALFAFGVYVLFFASEDFYFFVVDTLTFENTSSIGHVVEWLLALDSMIANPLGIGLAMSGNFGSVEDDLRVGGENQFLIYGVQLGWLGMILYILLLVFAIMNSISVFNKTNSINVARVAFTGATVKVGLLLPLFTANVEIYTYVSWITWWMIGFSHQEYSKIKFK
ncbi:MAG: O-antigen ligase family protein [Cyclobacteriaceae bacterium]|nr:O-antigen ligase family protein [Cyclobacteriaceae bacterium]MDX5466529.1 O-antigen ligase family protein [Cyclobacteriaceae bacterium]